MKISEIKQWMNFDIINREMLKKAFPMTEKSKKLYIYPKLGVIVAAFPSKKVRSYIYDEYQTKLSLLKRTAIWLYTRVCMHSGGIFANGKIIVGESLNKSTMVYPCGTKYRIFDFEKNELRVLLQVGFPDSILLEEENFRKEHSNAAFIIPHRIINSREYTEPLIIGSPLARVKGDTRAFQKKALDLIEDYFTPTRVVRDAADYIKEKLQIIKNKLLSFEAFPDESEKAKIILDKLESDYLALIAPDEKIMTAMTHGDFQEGNIWLEKSGDLKIIDWETPAVRYFLYDRTVLLFGLRKPGGTEAFYKKRNADFPKDIGIKPDSRVKLLILCEEFDFKLEAIVRFSLCNSAYLNNEYIKMRFRLVLNEVENAIIQITEASFET